MGPGEYLGNPYEIGNGDGNLSSLGCCQPYSYLIRGNALIIFDFRVPTKSLPFPMSPGAVAVNRVRRSAEPEHLDRAPSRSSGTKQEIAGTGSPMGIPLGETNWSITLTRVRRTSPFAVESVAQP